MRSLTLNLSILPTILGLLLVHSVLGHAETVTLRADVWCPYNCESDNPSQLGYMVDIAKAALEPLGHTVDYQTMAWSRAIAEAREGKIFGVVGAYRMDVPDFVFPPVEMGRSTNRLYVKKGEKWRYRGKKSLQGVKIGVIADYAYENTTNNLIKGKHPSFVVLSGDDVLDKLFKMLLAGRIQAVYEDPIVARSKLRSMGNLGGIEEAGWIEKKNEQVFIAFSPKLQSSKQIAEDLAKGIKALRASGSLQKILQKYDVPDWQLKY